MRVIETKCFRRSSRLRAPFYILAFVFWVQLPVGATNTETYRDIIEKAQTLSLQKERGHAVQLLSSSIVRESKRGPPPKELVTALEDVASLFMSDKAQQTYELALSLRENDPQMALQKLGDAAKIEPDNLQIQLEQFRVGAMLGNCSEAGAAVLKLYQNLSTLEVVRLAAAQAHICKKQWEDAQKVRTGFDPKKAVTTGIFWGLVDAELQLQLEKPEKALESLMQVQKQDPQFPESYYWQWQIESKLKKISDKTASKYVALCKALSPRAYRQYLAEPFLCRRVQEVETSLKKNNTPSA